MKIDKEELKKIHNEELNKLKYRINTTQKPEIHNELQSIKKVALDKLYEIIDFCEAKGIYFYSELPISAYINKIILEYMDSGISLKEKISEIQKLKKTINPILKRTRLLEISEILAEYRRHIKYLKELNFEGLYITAYIEYYKDLIANGLIDNIQNGDTLLARQLGMEENYKIAMKILIGWSLNLIDDDCKLNDHNTK